MTALKWQYLVNQLLNCTKKNFKKALKLSRYHDAQLLKAMNNNPGDPDYTTAYDRYHLLHQALETAYSTWTSKGGVQQGATLNITQLMKLMTAKVDRWWGSIINVYPEGTPRFKTIFPKLRKPFSATNTRSSRIAAVSSLGANIGSDAALVAQKAEVDLYYSQISAGSTAQTGDKGDLKTASTSLENARVAAMTGQYQNLGFFINKFPSTPEKIAPLFDVETITSPSQVIWKDNLNLNETLSIMEHTFAAGDMMRLKCTGITNTDKITFYLASTPGGINSTPVQILINHQQTIDVTAFAVADYHVNRFLTVVNNSVGQTKFLVQLY